MKVTVLLRNDHEGIKSLFDKYKKAGARTQNGRKEVFTEIQRELMIHSQMETEIFYPALTSTASTTAEELVAAALNDHDSVEKLLDELSGMNSQDRNFDEKMSELIDIVSTHIEKEEEEVFDEARKVLTEFRLEELGIEMEDRRKLLSQLAA